MKRHEQLLLLAAIVAAVMVSVTAPRASAQPTGMEAALALESTLVNAIAAAEDSVVAIARVPKVPQPGLSPLGPADPSDPDFIPNSYGTGVVVDARGLILTNYHVVGNPDQYDYFVWLHHRAYRVTRVEVPPRAKPVRVEADRIEAADPWLDLAVLRIQADDLKPVTLKEIKFGDAAAMKKGQIVIALGNPHAIARDGEVSATWGIVSNLKRSAPPTPGKEGFSGKETLHHFGNLIQTDAKLPQGTSGGALINLKGEMIGLTSSLAALSNADTTAGFAIPVDDAFKRTVNKLKLGYRADFGFLGVKPGHARSAENPGGDGPAARIDGVVPGTPAEKAHLQDGDVVTRVNGTRVYNGNDLIREVSKLAVGDEAELAVVRGDARVRNVTVRLSKKYLTTTRPPLARVEDPSWRGMRVDYATAIPPEAFQSLANEGKIDPLGCVAVVDVQQDSPAWKAGIRLWTLISRVGQTQVEDPEAFFRAVKGQMGNVDLRIAARSTTDQVVRTVPPR